MQEHSTSSRQARYWAVIPAAGIGSRMAADRPKQYLPLAGKTVIEHSLTCVLNHPQIAGAVVALAADDPYWPGLDIQSSKPLWLAPGGAERADSVLSALQVLAEHAHEDDWVLVHDAARPCLREEDLESLIEHCAGNPVGGLLAVAVKDTIKRASSGQQPCSVQETLVQETVDREGLWHAQTPQMFRLHALKEALARALAAGVPVTDESSAIEWAGMPPLLVRGHADNIKITQPEDLELAEFFLKKPEAPAQAR